MKWQTGQPTEEKKYLITTQEGEVIIASWTDNAFETLRRLDSWDRWNYACKDEVRTFYTINGDKEIKEHKAAAWAELPEPYEEDAETLKWINYDDEGAWECPCCKELWIIWDGTPEECLYNHCPKCGVRLEGEA